MVDLSVLGGEPYPAIALIIGGLMAIAVAVYGRRDDSHLDEIGTFFAFVIGIVMGIIAFFVAFNGTLQWFSLVVIIVLAVTLFLKPLKELPWAGLVGLAAGSLAVLFTYTYIPDKLYGIDRWIVLVAIFLIVGAIVHMLFHFIEDALTIARMVLDWRPITVIVGLVAVVEGALILMDSSIILLF